MGYCPNCGEQFREGRFCANCGSELPGDAIASKNAESQKPLDARARGPLVRIGIVALLVGAGLGLLVGYLVFPDEQNTADPATANLSTACELAERIARTHVSEEDWGPIGEDPAWQEAMALGQLVAAASVREEAYEHLHAAGHDISLGRVLYALKSSLKASMRSAANVASSDLPGNRRAN